MSPGGVGSPPRGGMEFWVGGRGHGVDLLVVLLVNGLVPGLLQFLVNGVDKAVAPGPGPGPGLWGLRPPVPSPASWGLILGGAGSSGPILVLGASPLGLGLASARPACAPALAGPCFAFFRLFFRLWRSSAGAPPGPADRASPASPSLGAAAKEPAEEVADFPEEPLDGTQMPCFS